MPRTAPLPTTDCPCDVSRLQECTARKQEAHRGFAPQSCVSLLVQMLRQVQWEEMCVVSELRVRGKKKKKKKYRVPLKTSDKKAHMIPELQSPIPSPKAASAFLSV